VTKLLTLTGADTAFFGEKDWQQLQIVRRAVRDLNLPVKIVGCSTMREADGLAMSSRNARLSPEDRARAPALHREMQEAAARIRDGAVAEGVLAEACGRILRAGFAEVEYLEIRDAESLAAPPPPDRPARLFAAAWLGGTRLIDNIPL
jgi:pantoate--beta-alanine ligase